MRGPRGVGGKHDCGRISSFVFAMVTERVFLVDGATLHHLLQPPEGLQWHWEAVFDKLGEKFVKPRAKLVNLQYARGGGEVVERR